jgi:polyribonucleotide nucleotidyltransferase
VLQEKNNMERKKFDIEIAGKKITAEFNTIAKQANGSVFVTCGGTTVMATVCMSPAPRETVEYFPLSVDYEEKFYAAGRILGSRFMRREGRPSEEAVLIGRLIDRTIRPLFDHKMRHDVQVAIFTLSLDEENSPDVLAIPAASLALLTSNVPWNGPVSAVRMSLIDDKLKLNPSDEDRKIATMDIVVSGGEGNVNMLEGKSKEIPEENILSGIAESLKEINKLNDFQKNIAKEIGKEKKKVDLDEAPKDLFHLFEKHIKARLVDAIFERDKVKMQHGLSDLKFEWMTVAKESMPEVGKGVISDIYEEAINDIVHDSIIEKEVRADGRGIHDVRELYSEAGLLNRTHGSGLFYRGDTHILSVATLGAPGDELLIEGMDVRTKKNFMHHYNFPPFSVGETGRMGSPGRREIGHGALAEKALLAVIPEKSDFPYTIRLVSETLSSNGSSSMGSVCASTLALMDAGVPIIRPVTGIAMGLMMRDQKNYKVLTDIQGPEDHHGDMDLKIAGTTEGVTAVQMDVKVDGVTLEILKDAFKDARVARLHILESILKTLKEPRAELSEYAPRVFTMNIPIDKIRDVIGPGGKMINEIITETGAQIDIEQTGEIFITGTDSNSAKEAQRKIESIIKEFEVGETVKGAITRTFDFGAMVEIAPRQEGLVHISELADFRVGKVTDIVNVGDIVEAKIISIDGMGRINLSVRALKETDQELKKRLESKPQRNSRPR